MSDSAGVRTVRIARVATVNAPELRATRVYRTDPDEVVLMNVEDGAFLADGSLLLANLGTSELVLLDGDGSETRRIGRAGEGPGEYRWPSWLEVDGGGVRVYDKGLRRLTRLGLDLTLVDTRRVDSDDEMIPLEPLTAVGDTLLAVHGASGYVRSGGEVRDTTPLLRLVDFAPPDTLGLWPADERAFATIPQGTLLVPVVFGRSVAAHGRAGRVAIGSTDSLSVRMLDTDGSVRLVIRGDAVAEPAGEDEVARYREHLLERVPMSTPQLVEAWSTGPARETVPPLGEVHVDDRGRIWIAGAVRPGRTERVWAIFGPDGAPFARVELPSRFWGWPPTPELLDVAGGLVALRLRSDLDEESIEVWRLH